MRTTRLLMKLAAIMFSFVLFGCEQTQLTAVGDPVAVDPMEKWSRSCSLCHINGVGGAPRIADTADWAPRLAQGQEVLLAHTIEGYNNMPPLGYCMDCERVDFVALIKFMSGSPIETEGSRP